MNKNLCNFLHVLLMNENETIKIFKNSCVNKVHVY
jgi:hypothetical protein